MVVWFAGVGTLKKQRDARVVGVKKGVFEGKNVVYEDFPASLEHCN